MIIKVKEFMQGWGANQCIRFGTVGAMLKWDALQAQRTCLVWFMGTGIAAPSDRQQDHKSGQYLRQVGWDGRILKLNSLERQGACAKNLQWVVRGGHSGGTLFTQQNVA